MTTNNTNNNDDCDECVAGCYTPLDENSFVICRNFHKMHKECFKKMVENSHDTFLKCQQCTDEQMEDIKVIFEDYFDELEDEDDQSDNSQPSPSNNNNNNRDRVNTSSIIHRPVPHTTSDSGSTIHYTAVSRIEADTVNVHYHISPPRPNQDE